MRPLTRLSSTGFPIGRNRGITGGWSLSVTFLRSERSFELSQRSAGALGVVVARCRGIYHSGHRGPAGGLARLPDHDSRNSNRLERPEASLEGNSLAWSNVNHGQVSDVAPSGQPLAETTLRPCLDREVRGIFGERVLAAPPRRSEAARPRAAGRAEGLTRAPGQSQLTESPGLICPSST